MKSPHISLKQLFAELTDYSWADSLREHERDLHNENNATTMFEVMGDEIRGSLKSGGGKYEPSEYGLKTLPPAEIEPRRDFEQLALILSEAMIERIWNGRSEVFNDLYHKAEELSEVGIEAVKPYLLSEAWADFKQFKVDWTHKIATQNNRLYEVMHEFWGDIDVTLIDKRMVKGLLSRYQDFPKGNIKPYHAMTVREVMAFDEEDIAEYEKVSAKTVKGLLKLCQSFFSAYLTVERDIFQTAPTANVRYEVKSVSYANFSDTQIRKLKEKAVSLDGWQKWAILLAIFTGARRGDITGLTSESLRLDEDTQRYYLWIKSGKTDAATRPIPLHKDLIKLGFVEFAQECDNYLFPEIVNNPNRLTYHAQSLMEEQDIPASNDKGQRYTLHSFRHSFITKVQQCGVGTSLFQTVVGHQKTELGISKRYTHEFDVKSLLVVVDSIKDW
ncbi:tyrosine-type recombinase/integrase [Shewanella sp. Scap07]|uniref:tyrosine-type recombinase/integrase n=1 Tax=Shewanella sp. Scap07 TaxID=2589987 RepID=UPI0015BC0013|nr:tyrosine-type recombinase/integrase [Shewanella sp. Scap07]